MYPDIIAIAIPFLVLSVVVEALVDRKKKKRQYSLNRTMSNIGCGVFEQVTGFLSKGIFLALYLALYQHRFFTWTDSSPLTWVVLIVAVDLIFYFYHRVCHRTSFLWSGHMIHHEVDEFNLTVALRRSALQEFMIIAAYLPLALIGFSPGAFFLIFAAHNLYQFYIHTPYFPEMRLIGLVLNTPHHHQVHHCRNERYVDKNFAGFLIIWDKMFGTFEPLEEEPEWGVHQHTTTLNPVLAQFVTLGRVLRRAASRSSWREKLFCLVEPPTWLGEEDDARQARTAFNPPLPPLALWVSLSLFLFSLVGVTVYRIIEAELALPVKVTVLLVLGGAIFLVGTLLDARWNRALIPIPREEETSG